MPTLENNPVETTQPKRRTSPFQNGRFHEDDNSHLAVTVGVPPEVAYMFFRELENLPLFMKDLESIEVLSDLRSRWTMNVKGARVQWEAEITADREGEMIGWRSLEGSDVETHGSIWFAPAPEDLGSVISLVLDFKIPGGKLTELATKISGEDPDSLAFTNLRRLKCYLETGEIATIEGQSSGREEDAEQVKH